MADQWRTLTSPPLSSLQRHGLLWTGDAVIVYGGHSGPGHPPSVLIYDPLSDTWTESSPMPISPRERMGGVWTGDELIIWGGYATYGNAPTKTAILSPETAPPTTPQPTPGESSHPLRSPTDATTPQHGQDLIIFGGIEPCGQPNIMAKGDAATYNPQTNLWQTLQR